MTKLLLRNGHHLRRQPVPVRLHHRPGPPGKISHGRTAGPARGGNPPLLLTRDAPPLFTRRPRSSRFSRDQLRRLPACGQHRSRYARSFRRLRRGSPGRGWITGGGWAMDAFPRCTRPRDCWTRSCPTAGVFLPNRGRSRGPVSISKARHPGRDRQFEPIPRRPHRADRRGEPIGSGMRARPGWCNAAAAGSARRTGTRRYWRLRTMLSLGSRLAGRRFV